MLISVTDLASYLYCPKAFYMQKVEGIQEPPSQAMIIGTIKHEIFEQANIIEKGAFLLMAKGIGEGEANELFTKLFISALEKHLNARKGLLARYEVDPAIAFEQLKKIIIQFSLNSFLIQNR